MKWPLAVSNFTALDKLRVGWWLFREKHWSQGEWVRAYEKTWEQYTGAPHAVMVSSGSAANHLIAYHLKDQLQQLNYWPKKNKIVFPVVNWISAVSPWLLLGFEPIFIDVSYNLCSSSDQVGEALKRSNVAAVFYTTLLGLSGDVPRIRRICDAMDVPLILDNCESTFSQEPAKEYASDGIKHICDFVTSSMSFYFSHHTSGNQEGGMIFCQNKSEADFYRMARNHGMTRGIPEVYKNHDDDPRFDFYLLGANHRSTNLCAYMASLDFKRAKAFASVRRNLSCDLSMLLDKKKYETPHSFMYDSVPLALPIVCKHGGLIGQVRALLEKLGVEYRPIVGGNLLRQTAFRYYGKAHNFPRAEHIHDNGVYVGLHTGVTSGMVRKLARALNSL